MFRRVCETGATKIVVAVMMVAQVVFAGKEENLAKGRIKEFDDLLRMYGQQVNAATNLDYAIEEAKRMAQSPEFNAEFANYYIEILELLQKTGNAGVIHQETDRLNDIITSASSQRGGGGEVDYALYRRNILGAFVDSAAEYIIHGRFSAPDGGRDQLVSDGDSDRMKLPGSSKRKVKEEI